MKKLRLKALSLGAKEILNRDQLQGIYGGFDGSGSGSDGGGGGGYYNIECICAYPGANGGLKFNCPTEHGYEFACAEIANEICDSGGYGCSN